MKLIAITPETFVHAEVDLIHQLFRAGLKYLHIRKPAANEDTVRRFITSIDCSFRKRLIVHRHIRLYEELALGGIHVDMEQFRSLSQGNFAAICSTSTHHIEAFKQLDRPSAHIFISPIYNSISKMGYHANPDLLAAGAIRRKGNLIALGGICCENILEVKRKGFDGAAILGHLWNRGTPLNQFKNIQKTLHTGHEVQIKKN